MHRITSPALNEQPRMTLVERLEVAKYDHDCEGGHGPGCRPFETISVWYCEGRQVTDPELLARIQAQPGAHAQELRLSPGSHDHTPQMEGN